MKLGENTLYTIENAIIDLKKTSTDTLLGQYLPNESVLKEVEKRTGVLLSSDYKKFLKDASNIICGTLFPLVISQDLSASNNLESAINEASALGIPKDWIPICEDNGDFYCILPDGQVRFWSHDGYTDESWPSLAIWIRDVWIGGK